ncbi:MAG: helix-turn-helix transcriptional regulator [Pseudomonadales bacterium]
MQLIDTNIREEVDLLYRAVADPSYLDPLLTLIRRKTQSCSGSIQVDDYYSMQVLGGVFQGFPEDALASYREHYSSINVLTNAAANDSLLFDRIFVSDQLMSLRQFKHSEFYADWVSPFLGTDYSIWLTLNDSRERVVKLTLQRYAGQLSYSADNSAQYLALLRPHLRAAVSAVQQVAQRQVTGFGLESLGVAAALIDKGQRLERMNRAFESLMKRGVFHLGMQGRLGLGRKVKGSLQSLLENSLEAAQQPSFISCESGHYYFRATPFIESSHSLLTQGMTKHLMLLRVERRQRRLDEAVLRKLYGLTPVESQLVGLLFGGIDLQQIGVRTGRTEHTVRSAFKQIFQKCGVSRQAQLVAKVAASNAYR